MTVDLFQLLNQTSRPSKGCVKANDTTVLHTNLCTVRFFINDSLVQLGILLKNYATKKGRLGKN